MTLLCVPIMVRDPSLALSEAKSAKEVGADIVEFRVDEFFDPAVAEADPTRQEREIVRLVNESPVPCIVTCRSSKEGGGYSGHESERLALYERLAGAKGKGDHPPRYVDIEYGAIANSSEAKSRIEAAVGRKSPGGERDTTDSRSARELSSGLILSMHDFQARPQDLTRRLLAMRNETAASVLKVAYRARSLRDNLELFEILSQADRPMIALAMGEFGLMSRVLAPKFGGFLTFASLRPETVTAPGQPTVFDLLHLFRFRSINAKTKVYGVIGWPVGHSMSPLVHNAIFAEHRFNGVYLPLPVAAGESATDAEGSYASFKATVDSLIDDPRLDFSGASVTIPHKENLARLARERHWQMDQTSRAVGAANTIVVDRHASGATKSVRVLNTDVEACLVPLRQSLGSFEGKNVAVFGAGGVARGIVFGLAAAGASVTVFNRDFARAERLTNEIVVQPAAQGKVVSQRLEAFSGPDSFDALINCTPVGMSGGPNPQGLAIPIGTVKSSGNIGVGPVVSETVYNPVETPLLRAAKDRGWRTIDGVQMFVAQAAAQSQAWTGIAAPQELMDRIVRAKLESKHSEE